MTTGTIGQRLRALRPTRKQLLLGVLGIAALVVAIGFIAYATTSVPNPSELSNAQSTTLYYSDGKQFGDIGAQHRIDVKLSDIPVQVREAVLAAEDRNYYSEPGISVRGIFRALWTDIRGGELKQGGSTITQQYAKVAYLTQSRTFTRKFKEIFIAIKLDRTVSKDTILQNYLNTIYFGRGAYGIEVAAKTYFGTDVSQLNAAQGAVLAALIRSPGYYDPGVNPQAAKARWQYVINGMVKEHWLSQSQAAALQYPPVLKGRTQGNQYSGPAGYVIEAAKQQLVKLGFSEDRINLGGLRVKLTISSSAEHAAVGAVQQVLQGVTEPHLQKALIAVQPKTGAIVAMYGGDDYVKRSFNNATQGQAQPGSSFKPFTLVAALKQGVSLHSRFKGASPMTIAGRQWTNFNSEQFPNIDLIDATAHSVNTVYVQLADKVGPPAVASAAHDAGIPQSDHLNEYDGITLGQDAVHPIDMADAYATFAAQGVQAEPYLIQEVDNANGHPLYRARPKSHRVFDPAVVADATYAMQAVVQRGTGTNAQLSGGRPAAGKTGTTTNNTAAWFCGYTPQLATAVAVFNDPISPLQGVAGLTEVTGGTLPARIWKVFMDAALARAPVEQFPPPSFGGTAATPSQAPSSPAPLTTSPTPTPTTPSPTTPLPTVTTLSPSPTPKKTTTSPSPTSPSATTATTKTARPGG